MQVADSVLLVPLHNPVALAEHLATMDAICNGRFVFGIGLGYRDEEYASFGVMTKDLRESIRDTARNRFSTARAWSYSPSALAIMAASCTSCFRPASSTITVFINLIKSLILSGELNRAVPPVGKTWLGPAT